MLRHEDLHLAKAAGNGNRVVLYGARTGGVILAKCDSRETLQARLSQDPFQQLGLARTEIIPFEASMASPALQSLL